MSEKELKIETPVRVKQTKGKTLGTRDIYVDVAILDVNGNPVVLLTFGADDVGGIENCVATLTQLAAALNEKGEAERIATAVALAPVVRLKARNLELVKGNAKLVSNLADMSDTNAALTAKVKRYEARLGDLGIESILIAIGRNWSGVDSGNIDYAINCSRVSSLTDSDKTYLVGLLERLTENIRDNYAALAGEDGQDENQN